MGNYHWKILNVLWSSSPTWSPGCADRLCIAVMAFFMDFEIMTSFTRDNVWLCWAEGHRQCCLCLLTPPCTDSAGHEQTQRMGTRVNIPQFDPIPIAFLFSHLYSRAQPGQLTWGPVPWPHYRSLQLFFGRKNPVCRRDCDRRGIMIFTI